MLAQSNYSRHSVILFDGQCNMCNAWVRFVIARDVNNVFRFAPLQSQAAAQLMHQYECAATNTPPPPLADTSSLILIEHGQLYRQSSAALRIVGKLGGAWWLLSALLVVPSCLLDGPYQFVARRRYRWFGRADAHHAEWIRSGAMKIRTKDMGSRPN